LYPTSPSEAECVVAVDEEASELVGAPGDWLAVAPADPVDDAQELITHAAARMATAPHTLPTTETTLVILISPAPVAQSA